MDFKRAYRTLCDVARLFDVYDRMEEEFEHLAENEHALILMGNRLGLSESDLQKGISPVPDALYKRYSVFSHLSTWKLAELMTGRYGAYRALQSIFGDLYQGPDVPSKAEEDDALVAAVRFRCDQKVIQINKLFPNTYPLNLPVRTFSISTEEFISYRSVYEMSDSWDECLQRFSNLFFSAIDADLPECDALELNLLATFFDAVDCVLPMKPITYNHIQNFRAIMKEEGFKQLSSYARIRFVIPFWRAREFYSDSDNLSRYISNHADAKSTIRSFLSNVLSYECRYTFIIDMDKHEYINSLTDEELEEYTLNHLTDDPNDELPIYMYSEPILIQKSEKELNVEDRLIAEHGKILVKSIRNGGVISNQRREVTNSLTRLLRRRDRLSKHAIRPQSSDNDRFPADFGEEGDFDE